MREVSKAADHRLRVFYDTGFNLQSRRQFGLRYVRELLQQASGILVGKVETFERLLAGDPQANIAVWKLWYLGQIPWSRKAITPASLLDAPELRPVLVLDGVVVTYSGRQ